MANRAGCKDGKLTACQEATFIPSPENLPSSAPRWSARQPIADRPARDSASLLVAGIDAHGVDKLAADKFNPRDGLVGGGDVTLNKRDSIH